jgi:hypothetical protein
LSYHRFEKTCGLSAIDDTVIATQRQGHDGAGHHFSSFIEYRYPANCTH